MGYYEFATVPAVNHNTFWRIIWFFLFSGVGYSESILASINHAISNTESISVENSNRLVCKSTFNFIVNFGIVSIKGFRSFSLSSYGIVANFLEGSSLLDNCSCIHYQSVFLLWGHVWISIIQVIGDYYRGTFVFFTE